MKKVFFIKFLFYLWVSTALAEPPNWNIIPNDFEYNQSVTAVLNSNDIQQTNLSNIVGAFVNGECRGIAENPIIIVENVVFFMTIYSNSSNEVIEFVAYFQDLDEIINITETILTNNNSVTGSPVDPFEWNCTIPNLNPPENLSITYSQNNSVLISWSVTVDTNYYIYESSSPNASFPNEWECLNTDNPISTGNFSSAVNEQKMFYRVTAELMNN